MLNWFGILISLGLLQYQYHIVVLKCPDICEVPTKCVRSMETFDVYAKILFIDFEGRSDGESIHKIISQIRPRQLVSIYHFTFYVGSFITGNIVISTKKNYVFICLCISIVCGPGLFWSRGWMMNLFSEIYSRVRPQDNKQLIRFLRRFMLVILCSWDITCPNMSRPHSYVCFPRMPQGFPLPAFLHMILCHKLCNAYAVTLLFLDT